jgi:OmpA-OmpF porin, OOP family
MKYFTLVLMSLFSSFSYSSVNDVNYSFDDIFEMQNNEHYYIGLRGGWANYSNGCSSNNYECNNNVLGYGLYAGYQLSPWLSIETALNKYGRINANYGTDNVSADIWGSELTGVFSFDAYADWDAYLRVGPAYQNIDKMSSWGGRQKSGEWSFLSAVGLDYILSTNLSLRGEYQFIQGVGSGKTLGANLNFLSLGLTYHFGQSKSTGSVKEDMSIVAIPKKKLVIPGNTALNKRDLNLVKDIFFEFDSINVENDSEFVGFINSFPRSKGIIIITGYADSIGNYNYNKSLSKRRAQYIAEQLILNGINPSRIEVQGKGELEPIANNQTIEGRRKNRRVNIRLKR